jgi:hypothetical protein
MLTARVCDVCDGHAQVLPPKADIEVVKLGGGSRTVLYFVEAQPLFFDPSGRDDWVPTGTPASCNDGGVDV